MPSQHALLSPSAAHRWINCTPSVMLEQGTEDKGSDYAKEGTLAHAYAAKHLKEYLSLPTREEDREIEDLADYATGEMPEHVQTYTDYVIAQHRAQPSTLIVENRYDLSTFVPEAFGTSDATIIRDGELEIVDLKYGKGVRVEAEDNPQLMIYALGALDYYAADYAIERVRITIIQPRLDHVSSWTISTEDLLEWALTTLKPAAQKAIKGDGEQCAGDWCKFCKIKPRCRKLADYAAETMAAAEDPRLLKPSDYTDILPRLDIIKAWAAAAEEHALDLVLNGQDIDGYKVVEGRSIRKITNQEAAAAALTGAGYSAEHIYKPKELHNLTTLEKLCGKKSLAGILGDCITKPQGKPTLVPLSDKRQPYNAASADFANF